MTLFCAASCARDNVPLYKDTTAPLEQRVEDALSRLTLEEKVAMLSAQSKFSSPGVPRLGIPDIWMSDGPFGVREDNRWDEWGTASHTNDSCTAFPALSCLAATWDRDMALRYGQALGEESRYRGKTVQLAPGVNIFRTPLCGRNFEYMGEDPLLVSRMAVPYIQGIQQNHVAACIKHYALNNQEAHRHDLREISLPAFEAAVKDGGVWSVMGAYNKYKGKYCCENAPLVNGILKGEWGFDGVVISDWGGTHDTWQAITNGLDMEFGSWTNGLSNGASNAYDNYYLANPYLNLIREGKVGTTELDDKVRRILRLIFRTVMNPDRPWGSMLSPEHYEAARRIGEEGIVLLQNKGNVLPIDLNRAKKILVVGENAIKMMTVGGGSSSLKVQREISPLDGLKTRLGKDGIEVDYARGYVGDVTGNYNGVTTGQNLEDKRSEAKLIAEAVEKAKTADYVIMFGGLNKSDFQDCEGHDRKHYELPYHQDKLIEALAKANRNFVYVNISGNAVAMPWKAKVAGIVQGWFIGSESGEALASILTGDANPSGKLPFTWVNSLKETGAHALNTYPGTWRQEGGASTKGNIIDEEYKEGIYVGYRWTDKERIKPTFAFGHGLSYTQFAISNLRSDKVQMKQDGTITFTVNVKNTGKRAGAETVQLYIHDVKSSVDRPQKELKGFQKVYLQPGESKDISITISKEALSFYDEASSSWKAEAGKFEALVGNAADNLKLKKAFELF